MKMDNLDRMELSLINKIETYRSKYYKDPKVLAATALMEDAKRGYLESNFGGTLKKSRWEIFILLYFQIVAQIYRF